MYNFETETIKLLSHLISMLEFDIDDFRCYLINLIEIIITYLFLQRVISKLINSIGQL